METEREREPEGDYPRGRQTEARRGTERGPDIQTAMYPASLTGVYPYSNRGTRG